MIFTISLKGDGEVFLNQQVKEAEVARILRDLAVKIEDQSQLTGVIRDINNNAVGEYFLR
jgi:hypothetical protein